MSQKKVYSSGEHKLDPSLMDEDAIKVALRLKANGHAAYLVGGCVRDLLLGYTPKDYDLATSARPEEVKALFRGSLLIGKRFQLAHVRVGRKVFEVSTFRKGSTESDELIVRDNEWGSEKEDALRRDFTINGLFYDPQSQEVIDYVGGFADLESKTLRVIGHPHMRFRQDPVRMLRLLKFKARFDLEIPTETLEMMCELKEEILKSAPPRVLEEILRMLESRASLPFFKLLAHYGFLELLMPKVSHFIESDGSGKIFALLSLFDTYHTKNSRPLDRAIMMSALLFGSLENRLKTKFEMGIKLHLGVVQEESLALVREACLPFIALPRNLAVDMSAILMNQFRFVPIDGKPKFPTRPPNIILPHLSMQLLAFRSKLNPSLAPIYKTWREILAKALAERM